MNGAKMNIAKCHPGRKMKAKEMCAPCYERHLKVTNPSYRERQLSNTTSWMRQHPEKAKEYQARRVAKDKASPDYQLKQRNRHLARYGLTDATYTAMLESQGNACALCYRKPERTRFHVDHCHKTNVVRGILCHQCNWYLGTVDEDPQIIERIRTYLGVA